MMSGADVRRLAQSSPGPINQKALRLSKLPGATKRWLRATRLSRNLKSDLWFRLAAVMTRQRIDRFPRSVRGLPTQQADDGP
jgi:hypothetical protein